jgi:hypothetical protein
MYTEAGGKAPDGEELSYLNSKFIKIAMIPF